jgi:aspartyl-tRNA(Asn)/glutamyl-tRNA(Gln) amidotransferase subunit C
MDLKTIKHIATLARIKLTEKEEEKMKNELSSILNYVEQLNKVNTDNVEPLYQTTGLINSTREDEHRSTGGGKVERLVSQAPERQDSFVKVRSILNK